MTRARALKTAIRARAAKTGERYTTARRHVLKHLHAVPTTAAESGTPAVTKSAAAKPPAAKGGLSEAATIKKTGHGLQYWFAVLDRFGAVEKGHTASARHLATDHSVPGWHAQNITVTYERARGVRAANQRCDGEYEVSASKVVSATVADAIKALTDPRARARWTKELDAAVVKSLGAGLSGAAAKGVVVRSDGQARFRYKWGETIVQGYLYPKPGNKVSVVITNSKLTDASMVEQRRTLWRAALNALAQSFV